MPNPALSPNSPFNRTLYRVTRQFTGGILKGLTYTDITSVKFEVGFVCERPAAGYDPYRILAVEVVHVA